MKLSTTIDSLPLGVDCPLTSSYVLLGSCFADSVGAKMRDGGFDVCINPFGTLYNPVSIARSVERLVSGLPFTRQDCVRMGAGSPLICSFSHHTSFARACEDEFLSVANAGLDRCSAALTAADRIIITLGTAWVWEHIASGQVVSNCLKLPASNFIHRRLGEEEILSALRGIVEALPGRKFIFTVSPIRHLSLGAHANTLSKAALQLACDRLICEYPDRCAYFPAYEIVLDELRDYRFFADDLVHPSQLAVDIVWERFLESCARRDDLPKIAQAVKEARRKSHRSMH